MYEAKEIDSFHIFLLIELPSRSIHQEKAFSAGVYESKSFWRGSLYFTKMRSFAVVKSITSSVASAPLEAELYAAPKENMSRQ